MARERQSPEEAPAPQELERFSPNALHEVVGIGAFITRFAENEDHQLLMIDRRSIHWPVRRSYSSEREYEQAVAKTEALRGLVNSNLSMSLEVLEAKDKEAIDGLIGKGQQLGIEPAKTLSLSSLHGAFRERLQVRMKEQAELLTQMISDTDRELWIVVHDIKRDARVARLMSVALTGEGEDMCYEPVVLDKTGERKGFLPRGYVGYPYPLHIVTDRSKRR